ncbi:MAG: ABC transporter ATP-binding protein [Ruminococcaceae bacterium]|nr:ABC transporter ATP-binding protein [Oscillospiraceae bacterium]
MKKKSDLSVLMGYAGKHRVLTYLSWVLAGISAVIALVPFWYLWRIIREVLDVSPDFSQAVHISEWGWAAMGFSALAFLVYIAALLCSHLAAFRVATNLRIAMTRHIAGLPLGFAESFGTGKLRKIINECSGATETYLAHMLPDTVTAYITPIALLVIMMVFDWRLGLLSLVPAVLAFIIMMVFMTGNSLKKSMTEYQDALNDMSNEAVEYVRGIPVVKTFGQTVFSFKKFKGAIDRYGEWTIRYTNQLRLPMMFLTTAVNAVFAMLVAAAIWFTADGVTNEFLLNLMFYIIITPLLTVTLTKIMFNSENKMVVSDAISRIDSVMSMKPLSQGSAPVKLADHSVELRNVSYSYDGSKKALDGISLKIGSGQTCAFVGPSGGGKTTLANIISRFFDADSGEVLIGGVNVRDFPKEQLMDTVSFVFQNSRLIKGTILENVRMARPEASDDEVLRALEAAQCSDILEKLPDGVNTIIGTGGIYLSGGEQQRVAIARVILKDSPVVILDEATAFADPDNEVRVQKAFAELLKGRTVIMIAHRLSTVINADRIFVLADGKIAESGSGAELSSGDGIFAKMWSDYRKSVDWKIEKEGAR